MSKKPKKKRMGDSTYAHRTETGTIHEEYGNFGLGPGRGFNDPFFQQPNPYTVKTSSVIPDASHQGGAGGGEAPPNVAHGTGPMGPNFCRADYNFHAPNLKGVTNYIHAQNVMIGDGSTMNIRYNGFQDNDDSDSGESSSEPEVDDLQAEYAKKRKEEERYEKQARFQDTIKSSRPISIEEMQAVSKCLLGAWRKFLRNLDIDDEILDKNYQEYMSNGGLAEVVYQSLEHWRRTTESPEVQKVAHALGRVNMWQTVSDHLHP